MTVAQTEEPSGRKPLRLWPGVAAVTVQWLAWAVVPIVAPDASLYGMFAALGCGVLVLVWWLFFSRAAWVERVAVIVLIVLAVVVTKLLVHPSIAGGAMGMLLPIFSVPAFSLALVVGAVASRRLSGGAWRAAMAGAIVLTCGVFTLLRTDGIRGDSGFQLRWRWTKTAEERLLAQGGDEPARVTPPPAVKSTEPPPPVKPDRAPAKAAQAAAPSATVPKTDPVPAPGILPTVWPGFRGPERDNVVRGLRIETDWSKSPPAVLWRKPIGPGWSSFAVQGNFVYTQEQRGEEEVVSCYDMTTGAPVWRHRDKTRFWESNGGAGPRGTPAISDDRLYTLGATGILNAIDASSGAVIWSRNAATDTGAKLPGWGFAGSPLVMKDVVIVATAGRLAGYDAQTGKPRWSLQSGGSGYSSPHLATIGGVPQVVLLNTSGAISVAPEDGKVLWKHEWRGDGIVQPAVIEGGDILLGSGSGLADGVGLRRIAVTRASGGWTVKERWTSNGLKPYYNDFVVHNGHAFGFDGSILACVDLNDGKRKWKGGRYGHGQLVLLRDQDLLLVLSEEGELALVRATPDQFTEVARLRAIEGKTWNHPVVAGDVLLVRNGEEMAAFRLPAARYSSMGPR